MNRLHNLDYLRGIAAFGIMIYHYLLWTIGEFPSESFMGRVGIYGVSIFYVLSGLTLYYVYYDNIKFTKNSLYGFYKKRIFRLFPLLWIVTLIAIALTGKTPDFFDVFLNLTGLFGFVKWDMYFSAGIWSIGNELVFYTFFPFFILFTKSFKPLMVATVVIIFTLYLYFAFIKLDSNVVLSEQWRNYINPLNQVFLFLGGFLVAHFLKNVKAKNSISIPTLFSGLLLFVFYPAEGDNINLVTGANRIIFTCSCFLICIGFYKLSIKAPNVIHKPLTMLGKTSYSVYLLHPIVYSVTVIVLSALSNQLFYIRQAVVLTIAVIFSLALSHIVYEYFEKFFMRIGSNKQPGL